MNLEVDGAETRMRVLVTGAAGFVAWHVIENLEQHVEHRGQGGKIVLPAPKPMLA